MNKAQLIEEVAKTSGLTKSDSEKAVVAFLKAVMKNVKKEPVQIVGFGTWRTVKTKARNAVNPQTGKEIKVPAKKVMRFKASKNPKF